MKEKKLLSLTKKFEENPFMKELDGKMFIQPKVNTFLGKGEAIINHETGEIKQDLMIAKKRFVDKSQFAKIYASEIGFLFDLPKSAINVFMYLTKVMNYENEAYLDYGKDFSKVGYKNKLPIIKGLRELFTKEIIAPSQKIHHYWLNPIYVCKGERYAKYTEYIATDDEELIKQSNKAISNQIKQERKLLDKKTKNKLELAEERGNKIVNNFVHQENLKQEEKLNKKKQHFINPYTGEIEEVK